MNAAALALAAAAAAVVLLLAAAGHARLVPARRLAGSPRVAGRGRVRWRRRASVTDRDMAGWCEVAAREMRAGASLARAVERASRMQSLAGAAFTPALDALRRGQPLTVAIERVDVERARPLGVVVPVLRACTELGGPAAPPLERAAATLHGRADADAERWAHSAQARLSAAVLTILPLGVLALLAAGEPSIRASLVTPPGMICVVAGGVLNAAGWWWMRRVIGAAP